MAAAASAAPRDAILSLLKHPSHHGTDRPDAVPLDWDDIGYLSHGLVIGNRPLLQATGAVTERYSLGPRGGWMLNLIAGGVVHPHELSALLKIGRSLVSAELTRLTEAGLIESQTGQTDRRRSELALTARGKAALAEIRAELFRILTGALTGYSPAQVRLLAKMLHDLQAASTPLD